MPAYDGKNFSPPAPILHATLRNSETGTSVSDVMLFIDTGADVTLLPMEAADSIGIERSGARHELVGYGGMVTRAEVVRADLALLGRTFRGRFLLTDDKVGILGRDILNSLSLVLDGPRLTWEEHAPARDA